MQPYGLLHNYIIYYSYLLLSGTQPHSFSLHPPLPLSPFNFPLFLLLLSMPHSLPPIDSEIYSDLISLISANRSQTLEIDILPSSYPPEIHSAAHCIALPKPLLASLFLIARRIFLSYLSSQREGCDQDEDSDKDEASSKTNATSSSPPSYSAALDSTLVVLLWDPNHLTAANFRKKHLLSLRICPSTPPENNTVLLEALAAELHYLTSLLTSPLPKHTKSSTLWSHRRFLLRTFDDEILHIHSFTGSSTSSVRLSPAPPSIKHPIPQLHSSTATLWNHELSIILLASERHPRNYYAWNYARQLLDIFASYDDAPPETEKIAPVTPGIKWRKRLVEGSVAAVQKWCFAHPRDISGWAFLVFLLLEMRCEGTPPTAAASATAAVDNGSSKGDVEGAEISTEEDAAQRVVAETKEFVRKFGWNGASVEWFLKAMGE